MTLIEPTLGSTHLLIMAETALWSARLLTLIEPTLGSPHLLIMAETALRRVHLMALAETTLSWATLRTVCEGTGGERGNHYQGNHHSGDTLFHCFFHIRLPPVF